MKITDNPYLGMKEHISAPDEYQRYGLIDAVERSLKNESLTIQMAQRAMQATENNYKADPNYTDEFKQKDIKQYSDGIHPDFVHNLERANSLEELMAMSKELKEETRKQQHLESYGVGSFFINLGSNLVDIPLILGATALAPIAVPSLIASGSLNAGRRALLGATTEMVLEGGKDLIGEQDRNAIDYSLGAIFGAGVSAAFKNNALVAAASSKEIKRTLGLDTLEAKLGKAKSEKEATKIYNKHFEGINFDNMPMSYKDAVENLKDPKVSKFVKNPIFDALRVDTAFMTAKSKSKSMSNIADQWFTDNTLQANKADSPTLIETANKIEDQIIDQYSMDSHKIALEYGKVGFGKGFVQTRFSDVASILSNISGEAQMRRNLYNESELDNKAFIESELLQRASQTISGEESVAQIKKLTNDIFKANSKAFTHAHDILTQNGKAGFSDGSIPKTETYMPIMYNRNMSEILANKDMNFGHFKNFILDSAMSKLEKDGVSYSEEQLAIFKQEIEKVAENIWKNKNSEKMINQSFDDMFKAAEMDSKGLPKFTEFRSPLDYSFKKTFKTGAGEQELSFMDLVETDMTGIISKYSRKAGGTTALEKTFVERTTSQTNELLSKKVNNLSKKIGDVYRELFNKKRIDRVNRMLYEASKRVGSENPISELETLLKNFKEDDAIKILDNAIDAARKDPQYEKFGSNLQEIRNIINSLRKDLADSGQEKEFIDEAISLFLQYRNAAKAAHKETQKVLGKLDINNPNYQRLFKDNLDSYSQDIEFDKMSDIVKKVSTKDVTEKINLDNAQNIDKARTVIKNELIEAGATNREIEADLTRFDQIVKELQGLPTAEDPFGLGTQAQRIMKNLNIARLLGQTGWTMTAELGSTVYESGIKNFMEFSSFKSMMRQFRTGEIDDRLAQEIQLYTGLGANLNRAIGVNKYEHDFSLTDLKSASQFESALNKLESLSEKATEATLLFGGVKPLTAGFEMVMAKSILHEVLDIARKTKLSTDDLKFLNEVGMSDDMAKRVLSQINKHGKMVSRKWANGHKVTDINFDKWDDLEAQDMLIISMRRKAHQVVQRSSLGDKLGVVYNRNLFKNSLIGRFFLELKDYMITSYVKQFGRAVERRDAYVIGLMATQASLLTLGTAMQNYTNFAGNQEKLEKSFEPNNFARTVVGRLPAASYIPTVVDNAARLATGDTVFNSNRYHSGVQDAFMSMPTVDLLSKAGQLFSLPYKTFGGEIKGKDVDNIFGVAPLGNTYGVRTVKEYLRALAEEKE